MTDLNNLLNWFSDKEKVLVSLSGGVDSALVAYAANKELGNNAIAVTADYKTLSSEELQSAKNIASEIGIFHKIIVYNELDNVNFVKNDEKRCFYCRDELSEKLIEFARLHQINTIVDGTQSDDIGDYRPGIDALHGHGIRSPLLENNFTKELVRNTAREIGLSFFDRPSNSCLASRIPWGQRVTAERLARIEIAEKWIKQKIDIQQVRVRDVDGTARIEVEPENIILLNSTKVKDELFSQLKMIGFSKIEIDPDGYSPGKLNVLIEN